MKFNGDLAVLPVPDGDAIGGVCSGPWMRRMEMDLHELIRGTILSRSRVILIFVLGLRGLGLVFRRGFIGGRRREKGGVGGEKEAEGGNGGVVEMRFDRLSHGAE